MKRLVFALAVLALSGTGALADSTPRASAGPSQMGLAVGATPVFLTVPQFASNAEICAVGAAVNYRDDGQPVVATLGILIPVGTCIEYFGPLASVNFIENTTAATLNIAYYR